MTYSEYQALAQRTSPDDGHDKIGNACLGLVGEAGEVVDTIKKLRYQGLTFAQAKRRLIEELGDVCWYIAEFCAASGCSMADLYGILPELTDECTLELLSVRLARKAVKLHKAMRRTEVQDYAAVVGWWRIREIFAAVKAMALILNVDMQDILAANIRKLRERYPEGFDTAISNARYEEAR